jgi:hypothetical protein
MDTGTETKAELDLLWGSDAIAQAIGRKPRITGYLLEKGFIPAKKVGGRWCASRQKLREFFEQTEAA